MPEPVPPMVVPLADVPVTPAGEAVTRVRIARTITRARCGSELMQGVRGWTRASRPTPGRHARPTTQRRATTGTAPFTRQTYFIIRGHLRLTWEGGALDVHENDSVYLAPGHTYHLENVGAEPAFFVYAMTPTQE